ncbi:MAG: phosphoribosylformylglycinamidine synthase subunit PurQ [bacterium]|nr:phosphoribosylformylglycinamidine synthase subunit PurQ [bacterium]
MKPKVLILKTDGTNCDEELAFAFKLAGGDPKIIHVNELRTRKNKLNNYQILAIPGGFSYGDDVVSGKILAIELTSFFSEELKKFIKRKNTLIIGVCNGFQVLVRTGLLPFGKIGKMDATLTNNDSGHFECRWINLGIEPNSKCVFLNDLNTSDGGRLILSEVEGEAMTPPRWTNNGIVSYQVAHGEGKFFAPKDVINKIEKQNLVVFRYVNDNGKPTQEYPQNPNGSLNAIAGICDPTGRILGLMPHPERFTQKEHHPNWRRNNINYPQGLPIFENMIKYVKNN